ncbi:alpha/beta-hydrolase [Limtongia smithiae]|uniref:alpha/beta-hydrolase n=1 Tax=Limtongia smithiae TaxID=1125753 RepID=UPI0034CD1A3D
MTSAAAVFDIDRLVLPGVSPRTSPRAVRNPETDRLDIVAKRYTPKSNPSPRAGDVTIVAAHANGFPKELYEPFFVALLHDLEQASVRVRYIFISDIANEGESGIVNESKLGDRVSWLDSSRDLFLAMQILNPPPPVIGIGHSFGGAILAHLAYLHPSFFAGLVGIDPIIDVSEDSNLAFYPAEMSSRRRDVWKSQADAERYFKSKVLYKRWDPRVFEIWMRHGLRELPTPLYPDGVEGELTLATTRFQEVYAFVEPNPQHNPEDLESLSLGRPDAAIVYSELSGIRTPILFVVGEEGDVVTRIHNKMAVAQDAQLKVIGKAGHLVPMEQVEPTAAVVCEFVAQVLEKWNQAKLLDARTPRHPRDFDDPYIEAFESKPKL